jgi:hypothetical protein
MPTPNDALNYAKRFMGNMPLDDATIKLRILDDAHKKLWMAAPWSWTLAPLEVVQINNDTQDHVLSGAYADLLGLVHVSITNGQEKNDLAISAILPVTTVIKGRPSQVQYVSGTPSKLRLLPVPTGYPVNPTTALQPKIISIYKKKSATIDTTAAGNDYTTTSGVPAEWFWVYQEIVLLKAFQFTHDPRLGSVSVTPNGIQFTGQYAAVEAAIAEMRRNEEKLLSTLGEEIHG